MKDNYSAIVLAAGTSSRMTQWKPGALIEGKPVLYYSLKTISAVCTDIVVAGGYNFNELEMLVSSVSEELGINVKCAENKSFTSGMFSSVKTAISKTTSDNVFIALSDMPFVDAGTYNKLISEGLSGSYDVIYPAVTLESGRLKKGHPVLINAEVKKCIINTSDDAVLRDVLKNFKSTICPVDDEGINFDIDTDEDLERAKKIIFLKKECENCNDKS